MINLVGFDRKEKSIDSFKNKDGIAGLHVWSQNNKKIDYYIDIHDILINETIDYYYYTYTYNEAKKHCISVGGFIGDVNQLASFLDNNNKLKDILGINLHKFNIWCYDSIRQQSTYWDKKGWFEYGVETTIERCLCIPFFRYDQFLIKKKRI